MNVSFDLSTDSSRGVDHATLEAVFLDGLLRSLSFEEHYTQRVTCFLHRQRHHLTDSSDVVSLYEACFPGVALLRVASKYAINRVRPNE